MQIVETDGVMGAVVTGVDLAATSADDVTALNDLLLDRHMVCVRGQELDPATYAAAGRLFGDTQLQFLAENRLDDVPEVTVISNYNQIGGAKPHVRARHWHTDDSYLAVPAKATVLLARAVPGGGTGTGFINTKAVLEAMPHDLRARIDGKIAVHKYQSRRAGAPVAKRTDEEESETPDVRHPLVRTHPDTGEKALYINPNRIDHIEGMSDTDSDALLDELYDFAFQEKFQHHHHWQVGDFVIWDNRCTMHRAEAPLNTGELREFHRLLLKGTVPV